MKYLFIALAFVLFGCEARVEVVSEAEYNKRQEEKLRADLKPSASGLKIVEFDGCEYLQYYSSHLASEMTHKGNCKYCEARRNGKQN